MHIREIAQLDLLLNNYKVTIMFTASFSFYVHSQDSIQNHEIHHGIPHHIHHYTLFSCLLVHA